MCFEFTDLHFSENLFDKVFMDSFVCNTAVSCHTATVPIFMALGIRKIIDRYNLFFID